MHAVGILTAHCAQHRGAKRVILIDNVAYRLEHAKVLSAAARVSLFVGPDALQDAAGSQRLVNGTVSGPAPPHCIAHAL